MIEMFEIIVPERRRPDMPEEPMPKYEREPIDEPYLPQDPGDEPNTEGTKEKRRCENES